MSTLLAFMKKEWTENVRNSRLTLLVIIFILFGIMNPAIAKLTPWLMKTMAASLEETGLVVNSVEVDAMTSWAQFYKNIPMALVIYVLLFSSIITSECQNGTLIPILTKGLARSKVIIAKTTLMLVFWTLCYWLCYLITYGYNAYFWDNSIVSNLIFPAVCYYLFGIWIITLIPLMSTIASSSTYVLAGTAGIYLISYLISFPAALKKYTPARLAESTGLLIVQSSPSDYTLCIIIALLLSIINIIASVILFNRKNL